MGIKLWRDLKPVYAVDELVAPVCQRCPKPRHLRRCDVDADGPTVTRLRLGVRPDAIVTGQAQVRGSADLAYGNRICATGQQPGIWINIKRNEEGPRARHPSRDRKSKRLNSSH